MFLALIQKQMKILLRSPSEILILLLMPIVLILILSFALGSLMDGNSELDMIEMAVVEHGDEKVDFSSFIKENQNQFQLDAKSLGKMEESLPAGLLMKILTSKEMKEILQVTKIDDAELEKAKNSGEYSVILEIPEGFTLDYLNALIFHKKEPTLNVHFNENEQVTSSVIKDLLDLFQQQYTIHTLLGQNNLLTEDMDLASGEITSTIHSVDSTEKITASVYYTFSMTVMFILYVAGTIASQSFIEKSMNIFDRIVLARIHPIIYLLSILVSTIIIALLQVAILFAFANLVFKISFVQWELYLMLTVMLAIVVGGIAALLTAINYRFNSANASNLFSTTLVAIFAFFGGSYFNISSLSPVFSKVGMMTPNGAALDAYFSISQNGTIQEIVPNMTILFTMAVLLMLLAFVLFPKRGGTV
ncbi:ABC transporter permease [Lysinibacillus yapensis]|nr:ABC transporter permease [Lysinibacillus yapensis]